jgi:hypothetical protein
MALGEHDGPGPGLMDLEDGGEVGVGNEGVEEVA